MPGGTWLMLYAASPRTGRSVLWEMHLPCSAREFSWGKTVQQNLSTVHEVGRGQSISGHLANSWPQNSQQTRSLLKFCVRLSSIPFGGHLRRRVHSMQDRGGTQKPWLWDLAVGLSDIEEGVGKRRLWMTVTSTPRVSEWEALGSKMIETEQIG